MISTSYRVIKNSARQSRIVATIDYVDCDGTRHHRDVRNHKICKTFGDFNRLGPAYNVRAEMDAYIPETRLIKAR